MRKGTWAAVVVAILATGMTGRSSAAGERAPDRAAATLFILDPACGRYDPATKGYVATSGPDKGQPCDVSGRRPMSRAVGDAPASMVGALRTGANSNTAFFVGKCHIVTNCHAAFLLDLAHPSARQKSLFTFGQGTRKADTDHFAEHVLATPVAWGSCACAVGELRGEGECSVEEGAQDWALLKLADCDGDGYAKSYGYALLDPSLAVDPASGKLDPGHEGVSLFALGEPNTVLLPGETGRPNDAKQAGINDFMTGAWKSAPCAIKGQDGGMVFHSCPDVPGDSGGPIGFQDSRGRFRVVAIQRGMGYGGNPAEPVDKWDFANANKAVAVRSFYAAVIPFIKADQDALRK